MRILITGSTGFIGGSVGRFAANAGHEIVGIARRSQADTHWPGRHVGADVAQADISGIIQEINPEVIFHGAGTASVGASFTLPLDDMRAATMTFANLLEGVRRSGRRPLIIFPSSAAVYGNPVILPVLENAPAAPISPYGFHKLACEMLAREYSTCFGLSTLVMRVFSVFGPAQRRLLVWEIFQQLYGPGTAVQLQGSGNESRDYLYVDDLAAALLGFAQTPGTGSYEVFNMASGIETRICDLADKMCRLVAPHKTVEYQNRKMSGDPQRWIADMGKTQKAIPNWTPQPISDRLDECVKQWSRAAVRA